MDEYHRLNVAGFNSYCSVLEITRHKMSVKSVEFGQCPQKARSKICIGIWGTLHYWRSFPDAILRFLWFALLTTDLSLAAAGLPSEVYIWQRAWTETVRRAILEHSESFAELVALKGEVTWHDGEPRLAEVSLDYHALSETKRPIGLALRIGPYRGPFSRTNASTAYLADLAQKIVSEAQAANVTPSELQLDFDSAASQLAGYRAWVEVIRTRIAPVPLAITALPSWLEQAAFRPLVEAADGYVLQVHSLERPTSFNAPFTLCDPVAARRAVAKAAQFGIPFRVALPTYGYLLAFDGKGRFIGISAEGSAKIWPADARLKEVRAEPVQIAQLVREWGSTPPSGMKGILWYRLPVEGDTLNWRWPTFSAILQARIPRKSVRVESHRVEPGLVEISLVNDGELDISSRLAVQTRWRVGRLIAGDGLHGFDLADRGVSSARFETAPRPYHLPAGEQQVIGWLRLSEDREVQGELEEFNER